MQQILKAINYYFNDRNQFGRNRTQTKHMNQFNRTSSTFFCAFFFKKKKKIAIEEKKANYV